MKINILYVLGPSSLSKWNNNEIRYSLRSVSPANVSWVGIAGPEMPAFLNGIEHIKVAHEPDGSRYQNTQRQILAACRDDRVPEDLVLMNDDFMVRSTEKCGWMAGGSSLSIPTHRGPIVKRVTPNTWRKSVIDTAIWVEKFGIDEAINYEGHTPFPFHKTMARWLLLHLLREKEILQFRTAYGNVNHIGGKRSPNAKRDDPSKWPADFPFWSLPSEPSEKAKRFLERWLSKPSRWEV